MVITQWHSRPMTYDQYPAIYESVHHNLNDVIWTASNDVFRVRLLRQARNELIQSPLFALFFINFAISPPKKDLSRWRL